MLKSPTTDYLFPLVPLEINKHCSSSIVVTNAVGYNSTKEDKINDTIPCRVSKVLPTQLRLDSLPFV